MIKEILLFLILFGTNSLTAQTYRLGPMWVEKPTLLLSTNFTGIPLPIEDGTMNANRFNFDNPYTYVQVIYDERNAVFQLIIQTDFFGRIVYAGYSNNLSFAFDQSKNPIHIFNQKLKQVNTQFGVVQKIHYLLQCILERINYTAA